MKKILIIIASLLLLEAVNASGYRRKFTAPETSFGFGNVHFIGDIDSKYKFQPSVILAQRFFLLPNLSFNFKGSYFGVRGVEDFQYSRAATDKELQENGNTTVNVEETVSFKTKVGQFSFTGEAYLFSEVKGTGVRNNSLRYNAKLILGIGYIVYKTETTLKKGEKVNFTEVFYDREEGELEQDTKTYYLPLGVGFRLPLSNSWALDFDAIYHLTATDDMEGFANIDVTASSPSDSYLSTSVNITYKF